MSDVEKLSESLEDYLEAIYHIVNEKRAAKAKDIAMRLDVNSSSVTGALRSLAKRELVNYAPYDIITLTDEGTRIAEDVVKRHEILCDFLTDILDIDKKEAEENACRMEHAVSPIVMERLIEFVHFVKNCPIGGSSWIEGKGFQLDKDTKC